MSKTEKLNKFKELILLYLLDELNDEERYNPSS